MKIVVVTQDAPMYLSSLLDGFVARISATEHEIKAIIAFSPLFGNDIGKEIVKDVLAQTSKCESASDLKAYASLITSSVSNETIQGRIAYICFELCGVDSDPMSDVGERALSDHIEKKEIN